jgi:hypothetical protein
MVADCRQTTERPDCCVVCSLTPRLIVDLCFHLLHGSMLPERKADLLQSAGPEIRDPGIYANKRKFRARSNNKKH